MKLFPCKHPLDKVRLLSVITSPPPQGSVYQTTEEKFFCTHCGEGITKKYETLYDESDYVRPNSLL